LYGACLVSCRCVQLLKPEARERYASEVRFDPRAHSELSFSTAATVAGAWTTFDPEVLALLDSLHVWAPGFLENRLRWRERQPITVLELRAWRLAAPLVVPPQEHFWGCFSWLDLGGQQQPQEQQQRIEQQQEQHQLLMATGMPALDDAAFAARQRLCRQQLGQLADLQELTF
jgi:hypothetical protein